MSKTRKQTEAAIRKAERKQLAAERRLDQAEKDLEGVAGLLELEKKMKADSQAQIESQAAELRDRLSGCRGQGINERCDKVEARIASWVADTNISGDTVHTLTQAVEALEKVTTDPALQK